MSRAEAGHLTDQGDQAVKDAIQRYNAEGLAGLMDRARTGRPRKLADERRQELHDIVLKGPDVGVEHLSAYTREGLAKIVEEKWGVTYAVTSIVRILKETGLSRQKMRSSHPKKDPEAIAAFSKKCPACLKNLQRHSPASVCASSFRTKAASARKAASAGAGSRAASVRRD